MTRNGKIARLPRAIRQELNQRLEEGEPGTRLVQWLNSLPEVCQILERDFSGRPISEQNLSEWKQGGYQDWLRHQEMLALASRLSDESVELEETIGHSSIADHLSIPLGAALARCAEHLSAGAADDPKKRRELLAVAEEIAKLRRGDHDQERLRIERERWNAEQEKTTAKKKSNKLLAPFWNMIIAREFAGLFKEDIKNAGGTFPPDLQAFLARIGVPNEVARSSFPTIHWPPVPEATETESK